MVDQGRLSSLGSTLVYWLWVRLCRRGSRLAVPRQAQVLVFKDRKSLTVLEVQGKHQLHTPVFWLVTPAGSLSAICSPDCVEEKCGYCLVLMYHTSELDHLWGLSWYWLERGQDVDLLVCRLLDHYSFPGEGSISGYWHLLLVNFQLCPPNRGILGFPDQR